MPKGSHSHNLLLECPRDFFGSEILANRDFFWVDERRRGYFLDREKSWDFFGYCTFHQLSWCGIFWGIVDNSEVGTFLGIKYEPLGPLRHQNF